MSVKESLQEELAVSLAEALDIDRGDIDEDTNFVDLGLDSIIGVEWMLSINKQYDTSMTVSAIYDSQNLREFTKLLKKELSKKTNMNS